MKNRTSNIIRYTIGLAIGALILSMGRYKIHSYQLIVLIVLVGIVIIDLTKNK